MSTTAPDTLEALRARRVPPLGGFNLTFLAIEIRRLVRNRRTVLLTLVVPVALFLLLKNTKRITSSHVVDIDAIAMIGIAVYGAMLSATSGGAMVSIERALGWSRQLRITPLRPAAYIAIKMLTAMVLGLTSVVIVYAIGAFTGVQMAATTWVLTGILAWASAFVFAALGLFVGYLLPSQNVMQIIGPVLGVFALFSGLFIPIDLLPSTLQTIAPYMPPYGVAGIARYPLVGGSFDWTWVLSVVLWTAGFMGAAMLLFRRDTRPS